MPKHYYYFAYGSCMNLKDIKRTTPAEFVSAATLFDYRLAFTRYSKGRKGGVADIVKSSGDYVEGVIFKITDLKALDAREGAPFCYKRRKVKVLVHDSEKFGNVWTYEVVRKEDYEIQPSEYYKRLIREGAKQFLSKEYVIDLETNLSRFRAPHDLTDFDNSYDYRLNSLRERLLF